MEARHLKKVMRNIITREQKDEHENIVAIKKRR